MRRLVVVGSAGVIFYARAFSTPTVVPVVYLTLLAQRPCATFPCVHTKERVPSRLVLEL